MAAASPPAPSFPPSCPEPTGTGNLPKFFLENVKSPIEILLDVSYYRGVLESPALPLTHQAGPHGTVALLHALILAALSRIIDCLADMFALWQSGQLPAPAPALRRAQHPTQTREAGAAPASAHPDSAHPDSAQGPALSRPRRPRVTGDTLFANTAPHRVHPAVARHTAAHHVPRFSPAPQRGGIRPQPRPPPGRLPGIFRPSGSLANLRLNCYNIEIKNFAMALPLECRQPLP